MNRPNNSSLAKLVLNLVGSLGVLPALAQQAHAQTSWLDRPLVNWNRHGSNLPQLPQPPTPQPEIANADRCRSHNVRQPASAAEQALAQRGWLLFGPVYSHQSTEIVMALSSFDGMCRPLGYQAFVYWDGRYAGTLSPIPMDSRSDGALIAVHLSGPAHFSAQFARYSESDPRCCPSRVVSVGYTLVRGDIPTLSPAEVSRTVPGQPSASANSGAGAASAQ